MALKRMDNVLIVVDDLEAAKAFFIELGLKLEGEQTVEGPSTVCSPSSLRPSSIKNALAASRSSTTMRTLSIRLSVILLAALTCRTCRLSCRRTDRVRVAQRNRVVWLNRTSFYPGLRGNGIRSMPARSTLSELGNGLSSRCSLR